MKSDKDDTKEFKIELVNPSESALKAIFGKTDVRIGEHFKPLENVEITCTTPPSRGFLEHHPDLTIILKTMGEAAFKAFIKWFGRTVKNEVEKIKVNDIEADADEIGIEVAIKYTEEKTKKVEDNLDTKK